MLLPRPAPRSTRTPWPCATKRGDAARGERDAVLLGLDLLRDADAHSRAILRPRTRQLYNAGRPIYTDAVLRETRDGQTILDGKAVAQRGARRRWRARVEALRARRGIVPGLATVLVGDDPASRVYVGTRRRPAPRSAWSRSATRLAGRRRRTAELLAPGRGAERARRRARHPRAAAAARRHRRATP